MKDGTTRMAYKTEHAVDIDTDIVVAATLHPGNAPDTQKIIDTAINAKVNVEQAGSEDDLQAIVADKGFTRRWPCRSPRISGCGPKSPTVPR
jgi:transposase